MREVQQVVSLIISFATLWVAYRKIRILRSSWRWWFPLIVAVAVNALYYIAVLSGAFTGILGDLSATVRLINVAMWYIYARLMPPLVVK